MNRPSEEIERDVEAARGDLDRTVEALKDKMTPGQLFDEVARSFKGGGGSEMISNLGSQVKENPMALAMIGAGMAMLMVGRKSTDPITTTGVGLDAGYGVDPADSALGAGAGRFGATGEASSSVSDKASGVAASLGEKASELKHHLADSAEHARHGVSQLGGQAAHTGRKVQNTFESMMRDEPLIVGALGLALGVAVGAALPSTPLEDRTFGAVRDDLVEAGKEKLGEVKDGLKASGAAAYEAVKDEADHQGLAGGDGQGSLVDKAEAIVRRGVEAAREELPGGRPS